MELEKKAKRLMLLMERLRSATVVVEGAKDRASLFHLNVGKVVLYHQALRSPGRLSGEVVVLTDMDREGERKAKELYQLLLPYAKVDVKLRGELAYLLKLSHFESLHKRWRETMEELEV